MVRLQWVNCAGRLPTRPRSMLHRDRPVDEQSMAVGRCSPIPTGRATASPRRSGPTTDIEGALSVRFVRGRHVGRCGPDIQKSRKCAVSFNLSIDRLPSSSNFKCVMLHGSIRYMNRSIAASSKSKNQLTAQISECPWPTTIVQPELLMTLSMTEATRSCIILQLSAPSKGIQSKIGVVLGLRSVSAVDRGKPSARPALISRSSASASAVIPNAAPICRAVSWARIKSLLTILGVACTA